MGRVRAAYGGVRDPLRFEAERAFGLPSVTGEDRADIYAGARI
jgi:hypothetical protein